MPYQDQQGLRLPVWKRMLLFTMFLSVMLAVSGAVAQTFTVLHTFTGGQDGAYPYAGLAIDRAGNLYGTANLGGNTTGSCLPQNIGCGTVFKLTHSSSGWGFHVLYAFLGGNDGQGPYGRVTIRPDGLYGSTVDGGNPACPSACGTVYKLTPPTSCSTKPCSWTETVLYRFQWNNLFYPTGDLAFDQAGNIYGTTYIGSAGPGGVWQLKQSNGTWTENTIFSFSSQGPDGGNPYGGVILDKNGDVYGTCSAGGTYYGGTVFELTPVGSGWSETTLYEFQSGSEGEYPNGGLIWGKSGNLIGGTYGGGTNNAGAVYELTPSGGGWSIGTLYDFSGPIDSGPGDKLTMDAAGNLYGTTFGLNSDYGTVFKLTPSGGGLKETVLYRFTGGSDGRTPNGGLVLDSSGNIYGTTSYGGTGYGVVFEITP